MFGPKVGTGWSSFNIRQVPRGAVENLGLWQRFYSTLGALLMLMHEKPCLIQKSPRGRHLSLDFPLGRPYLRLSVYSSDGISVPGFLSSCYFTSLT